MTWVMWNLTSLCLETVLVSVQERCMVYARCTIGSEIILDLPDGTTSKEAQVEAHFRLLDIVLISMQDRCTVCVERTMGSEIVLDAPDCNPR